MIGLGPATLQRRLLQLVALVALPLLAVSAAAVWYAYESERARAEDQLLNQTTAMAVQVDNEFARVEALLHGLAASASLAQRDFAAFGAEAAAAAEDIPGATVALSGPDGLKLVDTLWQPGAPRVSERTAPNLMRVFDTGVTEITDLQYGANSRRLIIAVAVPVFTFGSGPHPSYVLIMGLSPDLFVDTLRENRLPPGWVGGVFDRREVVVARSARQADYVGTHATPLLSAVLAQPHGLIRGLNVEGHASSNAWSHAARSGYIAAVSVPEEVFLAPIRTVMPRVIAAGLVIVLAGLAVAILFARRVSASLRDVARAAVSGEEVRGGLVEVNTLATALRDAVRARDAALGDLRELNETLETRVKREVAERETAQARLVQAQKTEALGQLAGGLAHDFNNILQAVIGGIGLITRRPDDPSRVTRVARMIGEAAERGAAVSRRLLAFARRDALSAGPVDVPALFAGLGEVLSATLGGGIRVHVDLAEPLPHLLADRSQLEIVLVNLATNARDAMPQGGILTLGASRGPAPGSASGRDVVLLTVRDTGIGMDHATLARVSEPFFTTKPVGRGTGLGLAMARGFAEQSGGGFAIASTAGQGTTVTLWFPIAPAGALAPAAPPPQEPSPGRAYRILLVDDDDAVRDVLAEGLIELGHAVLRVASAGAALALIDAGERFDALVTDLSMPDMDGLALIAECHLRRPHCPAILLTGHATDPALFAAATPGGVTLMRKPVPAADLANRLRQLLSPQAHAAD